jgi:hypothetical protein
MLLSLDLYRGDLTPKQTNPNNLVLSYSALIQSATEGGGPAVALAPPATELQPMSLFLP